MTDATLAQRYAKGEAVAAIATAAGCDIATVHRRLRRLGVAPRGRAPAGRHLTKRWIEHRLAKGMTPPDIAQEAGCERRVIHDAMLRYGLGGPTVYVAELRRLYEQEGQSTYEVAEQMGVSVRTVRRWLQGAGIAMRPRGRPASPPDPR